MDEIEPPEAVAVCISRKQETLSLPSIPLVCYTEGWRQFPRFEKSSARIAYLAERRNQAVAQALSTYPRCQNILMIDSYYVNQTNAIIQLLEEYSQLSSEYQGGLILGGSTWAIHKTRILPSVNFFDTWTTPEGTNLSLTQAEQNNRLMKVNAVGGCYLYPRWVWEKIGYGVPEDLHGCEHNWLCEKSGLPVYLSLKEVFWHDPVIYPWLTRIRCTAHLGRFVPKRARRAN